MSKWQGRGGKRVVWSCGTRAALVRLKKSHTERERLKFECRDLSASVRHHRQWEAWLLNSIREHKFRRLSVDPLAVLEEKLVEVQAVVQTRMAELEEQNERLEAHLKKERVFYDQILCKDGIFEDDEVIESARQRAAIQQEMSFLNTDMARLGKLIQDFDGISRASDAALLSRHSSLERNRNRISSLHSSSGEAAALAGPGGGGCRSDSEVVSKNWDAGRARFFRRVSKKERETVEAAATEVPHTPPSSRKRQRSTMVAEVERLQGEAKRLEREAEESKALFQVVTSLAHPEEEPLTGGDSRAILYSYSDDTSSESHFDTDLSSIHTPLGTASSSSAGPFSVLNHSGEPLEGAGESEEPTPGPGELSYDWEQGGQPPHEITDSLDRGDLCTIVKKIDFDSVETCAEQSSTSSTVTCSVPVDGPAACEESSGESDAVVDGHDGSPGDEVGIFFVEESAHSIAESSSEGEDDSVTSSIQLSNFCSGPAMNLKEQVQQTDACGNHYEDFQSQVESKLEVQCEEELMVEARNASADGCCEVSLWQPNGETKNKLVEEWSLGDHLEEAEKLRSSLEEKVLALRMHVEHLESAHESAQEMSRHRRKVWARVWPLIVQALLFLLGVYIWLQSFQSQIVVPLPT